MLWVAGTSALCLLICLPLFMLYKRRLQYVLAAMYKAAGTLCAMIPALVAAIRLDPRCWIIAAGMLLHSAADYILEFNLYIGAGVFAAGHICLIAYFTQLYPIGAVQLICMLCFLGIMAYAFWRWKKAMDKQLPLFIVYGVILCLMCAAAMGGFTAASLQGILAACGGALFFVSDFMLCRRMLFPAGHGINWAIMTTYYAAQILFGISCLVA